MNTLQKNFVQSLQDNTIERLEQILTATRVAIEAALKKRKEHSEQITGELIKPGSAQTFLKEIKESSTP